MGTKSPKETPRYQREKRWRGAASPMGGGMLGLAYLVEFVRVGAQLARATCSTTMMGMRLAITMITALICSQGALSTAVPSAWI